MDVEQVGMDIHIKFGDSRSNGDIRLPDFVTDQRHRRSQVITLGPKRLIGVLPPN